MKIASIDIGSNTVLLLIAEVYNKHLIPIYNEYHSPRLGKGLLPGKDILPEKILHLDSILLLYKAQIEKYKCEKVIITATNAMRIASNSKEIVSRIKENLNLDVVVIDGNTEAQYSYLGAASTIPEIEEKMVIDIGGGSTEIIHGVGADIKFKQSFQTGVVSLTEKYLNAFPYSINSIKKAELFLEDLFTPIVEFIPDNLPTVAVAGTPTTLSCIKQGLKDYSEEKVEKSIITIDEMEYLFEKLKKISSDKMILEFGRVVKGREDVLFAGVIILKTIMKLKKLDNIIVSGRGLRYGSIINYINEL